jgi:hypothetical protein
MTFLFNHSHCTSALLHMQATGKFPILFLAHTRTNLGASPSYLPVACICSNAEVQWQMQNPAYVARTLLPTRQMDLNPRFTHFGFEWHIRSTAF